MTSLMSKRLELALGHCLYDPQKPGHKLVPLQTKSRASPPPGHTSACWPAILAISLVADGHISS